MNKTGPLTLVLLTLAMGCNAFAASVTSIPLKNRPAEELVPLIQPLLEANEVILPNGSELLIKADPARISSLHEWISQLDKPQHRLLITVIASSNPPSGGRFAREYGVPPAHRYQLPPRRQRGSVLEVQTLDGKPALIRIDELNLSPSGGNLSLFNLNLSNNQTVQTVSSGFKVIPRLLNSQVILDIEPWQQHIRPEAPLSSRGENAHTTLRAELGAWVEIGRQSDHPYTTETEYGLSAHTYETPSRELGLYLKVEDLDRMNGENR